MAGELEELKIAAALFGSSEAQAEAVAPHLRAARDALIAELGGLDDEQAKRRFAGEWQERYRVLLFSGLRDLPPEPGEEERAAALRRALGENIAQAGALMAAMLLLAPIELPLPAELDRIPDWLLADYGRFLLIAPRIFARIGDAERHHGFLTRTVGLFHRYVLRRPAPALAGKMADVFMDGASFMQLYFNEHNLRDVLRQRAELMESWLLGKGAPLAHLFPPHAEGPGARPGMDGARAVRVGLLLDHLSPHTETYFLLAHLEKLPRTRCTLFLYTLQDMGGSLEAYFRGVADTAVTLPGTDMEAAARLRADDLDVLIVGSNITTAAARRTLLACFRLARVHAIAASSPVTSGLTVADWFLSAELSETEAGARDQYTEQVYRMPGMLTRYAYQHDKDPATLSPSRAELGMPDDAVAFFSAANYFKVIPELSATWARILAQVPEAWLMLMPFNQNWSNDYLAGPFCNRVLEQVDAAGGDPSRVLILDPVPARADLHAVMGLADIYLDSFPFAGACSLLDPLLVGLPVVARAGRTFRGDVGAGMLRGLGLADMALADADAYVARAVSLARDPALRARARERIAQALVPRNPVFDSETASRNTETAVLDMAARAAAGETALLRAPVGALRTAVESLSAALARSGNAWFRNLTDVELLRVLLVPYFHALPPSGATPRMIDVGACVGQLAEPFLEMGWRVELVEPDPNPASAEKLAALVARHGGRARLHRVAISEGGADEVEFHRSALGLSGLSPSPHGATEAVVRVPALRLDRFAREQGLERLDFLKIDAEGWDFDALRSHDFGALPPRLAMVEFGTEFPRQTAESILAELARMRARGYDALIFSYDDGGNYKLHRWGYQELIAARFDAPAAAADGRASGNVIFFRHDDALFLATVLRLFLSFLPPRERQAWLPAGI